MKNFDELLKKYADFIVRVGVNPQPGQVLIINCALEGAPLARLCVRSAFEAGARDVQVNWTDDAVTRRRLALFAREPGTTTAVSWSSDLSRTRLITVIADWLDAHRERARLPEEDSATEARIIVAMSISLGDEAIREMHEVNGDVVIDLASYARARRRLAAVLADPAE